MADESTIAGIGTQLTLDTAQFDAAISRSEQRVKSFLSSLNKAQTIVAPTGRGGAQASAAYFPGQAGGGGSREMAVTPVFTAGQGAVRQLRTQLRTALGAEPIPLTFGIGRQNWGQLRRDIASAIGPVPITVAYGGGQKGGALDVVTAVVAQSSGISKVAARQQIRGAMASHGVDPGLLEKKERGGYVRPNIPFLAGERGPELVTPRTSGMVTPAHEVARLRREYELLQRAMGGYARAAGGAYTRADFPGVYENLASVFARGTKEQRHFGRLWYPTEGQKLAVSAEQRGLTPPALAAIVAKFSQNSQWPSNLGHATSFVDQMNRGLTIEQMKVFATMAARRQALLVAQGKMDPFEILKGPKETPFAHALLGDPMAVPVDRWMNRAAGFPNNIRTGSVANVAHPILRDLITESTIRLAGEHGEIPSGMQAIIWDIIGGGRDPKTGKRRGRGGRVGGIQSAKDVRVRSSKHSLNAILQSADYKRRLGSYAPFSADSSWLLDLEQGRIGEPEDVWYADQWERTHRARGGFIRSAYEQTLANRGGTFDRFGHQPSRGYAIELGQGPVVPGNDPGAFARAFRQQYKLAGRSPFAPYVGTWMPEGTNEIQIGQSTVIGQKRKALIAALKEAQIAGFDLSKFEEITPHWSPRYPSPGQMKLGMAQGGPAKRGGLPRGYRMEFVTPDDPYVPASQFHWAGERQKLFGKSIKKSTEVGVATNWAGKTPQTFAAVVTDREGNVVATAPFTVAGSHIGEPGGYLYPELTHVDPAHTGRGLATAMYVKAERFAGKQVKPAVGDQTASGQSLWLQKDRPFGRSFEPEVDVIRKSFADDLQRNAYAIANDRQYRGPRPQRSWAAYSAEQQARLDALEAKRAVVASGGRLRLNSLTGRWVAAPAGAVGLGNRPLFETDDPIPHRSAGGEARRQYLKQRARIGHARASHGAGEDERLLALRLFGSVGTAQHSLDEAFSILTKELREGSFDPETGGFVYGSDEAIAAALARLPKYMAAPEEPGMGRRYLTRKRISEMEPVPFLGFGRGSEEARRRDVFMASHGYDFNYQRGYFSDNRFPSREGPDFRMALKKGYQYIEGEGFGLRPLTTLMRKDWSKNASGGMVKPISYGAGFAHAAAGRFAAALRDVELANWQKSYEVATFLHPRTGKVLLQRGGTQSAVDFSDVVNDPVMMKMIAGSVMTHNHPGGFRDSPLFVGIHPDTAREVAAGAVRADPRDVDNAIARAMGSGLSVDDVGLGGRLGLKEVRATTPLFTYSMRSSKQRIPPGVGFLASLLSPIVHEELANKVRAGELSPDMASSIHHNELWNTIAGRSPKEVGLIHRRMLGVGQRAKGGQVGPYIVNENGPELFVPRRLEHMIPPDVMSQIPQRRDGGMVEMNQKPWSLFNPPEDGWIVPNHLKNKVPRAAVGTGPRGRLKTAAAMGQAEAERFRAEFEAQLEQGYFQNLGQVPAGRTPTSVLAGIASGGIRRSYLERTAIAGRERKLAEASGLAATRATAELPFLRELQTQQQGRLASAQAAKAAATRGTDDFRLASRAVADWTRKLNKTSDAIVRNESALKAHTVQMSKAAEAVKAAQPSALTRTGTFGAVTAATLVGGALQQVIGTGVQAAVDAGVNALDAMSGYALTGNKVTGQLAQQYRQTPNANVTFGQAFTAAGIGAGLGNALQELLTPSVVGKAGAMTQRDASDLYRAGLYAARGGAPQGLYGSYGGIGGGPIFAEQMGGGRGFTQLVSEDLGRATFQQTNFDAAARKQFGEGLGSLVGAAEGVGSGIRQLFGLSPGVNSWKPEFGASPQQLELQGKYVADLNEAMARGAVAAGDTASGLRLVAGQSKDVTDAFAAAGKAAGDEEASKKLAASGFALIDANGKVVASQEEYQRYWEQAARGRTIGSPEQFLKASQLTLQAARQISAAQGRLERETFLPLQFAGQTAEAPPVAGQQLAQISGAEGRFFGTGGGTFLAGIQSRLGAVQSSFERRFAEDQAVIAQKAKEFASVIGPTNAQAWQGAMTEVLQLGVQISSRQRDIAKAQSGLRFAEVANNMRLASRGLQDALGVAGRGGSEFGQLQRTSTLLGFSLQQRDINLEKAVAGFQVAGETPEERAARQRAAGAKADINQQLLDIAERTFTITASRGVTDASKTIQLLQRSQTVEAEVIANNAEISDLQVRQQRTMARASSYISEAGRNINAELDLSSEYVRRFGVTLDEARGKVRSVLGLPSERILGFEWVNGRRVPIEGATGLMGMTMGPTQFLAGEVKGEAVAILKNPSMGTLGTGGFGGGGGVNVQMTFTGDISVRSDADIVAIAEQVEERLAYRLQMVRR